MFTIHTARLEYDSTNQRWGINIYVEIDSNHREDYYIKQIDITNQEYFDDNWDTIFTASQYEETEVERIFYEPYSSPWQYIDCLETDMIFIKVTAAVKKGHSEEIIECDKNKEFILVTFNVRNIYDRYIQYIKNLNVCCDTPKEFINFFLKYEALKVSIATGNYRLAINMYTDILGKNSDSINGKNSCGCGRLH